MYKGQTVFYCLEGIEGKLENIIDSLELQEVFEVKLIMLEAITNAFIHGNEGCMDKPIYLNYSLNKDLLTIKVTDCGCGCKKLRIPDEVYEEDLLKESGRGLYLINYYSDKVKFESNSIIIKKYVSNRKVLVK